MQAHRASLAFAGLSLVLLVALAAWAALPATQAGPTVAVTVHDGSSTSMATPTPQAGFRIYLPLIMKGWLTWLPGTPTLTPTPSATPTPTASATPTNTPTPTLTATPTPLPARLEIIFLICEGTDERFIITNSGGQAQVMTGWRIHSVEGDQWYPFPYAYTLAADATVRVHSGPTAFSNPPYDLFWTTAYIWNNKGDEAVLHDSTGQAVDNHCCSAGCHP